MEHIPVHDQGRIGDCMVYAETELFDAFRHQTEPSDLRVSSPLYTTLASTTDPAAMPEDFRGQIETFPSVPGTVESTPYILHYLLNHGSCSQAVMNAKFENELPEKWVGELYGLQKKFQNYERRHGHPHFLLQKKKKNQWITEHFPALGSPQARVHVSKAEFSRLFGEMNSCPALLMPISRLTDLMSADPAGFITALMDLSCPEAELLKSTSVPKAINFVPVERLEQQVRNKLQALLNENSPLPVAIGFCSAKITKRKRARGLKEIKAFFRHRGCGGHEALVIGRRYNREKKSCELLVRNSWGANTKAYRSFVEPENGNVWVSYDLMMKNVIDLTYIER